MLINFAKRRIAFEDKQFQDYDLLLIADTEANKLPELKGAGKEGVYALRKLTDIQEMNEGLILAETIVVVADGIAGLKMACALHQRKKEVILVTSGAQVLSSLLDNESSQWIQGKLQDEGIRVITNNAIAEVLGNGDVKAIRLKTGKVIASQTVIFAEALADLRIFRETDLKIDDGIIVNAAFQTNLANVYAVDDVAQATRQRADRGYDSFPTFLEQQGEIVAASIQGQQLPQSSVMPQSQLAIGENLIHFLGKTSGGSPEILSRSWQQDNFYLKLFIHDQILVGGVLGNLTSARTQVATLIEKGTSLGESKGRLLNESLKPEDVLILLSEITNAPVANPS